MTNPANSGPANGHERELGQVALPWLLRRTSQRYRIAVSERLSERGLDELPQPGFWALMILSRGGSDAGQLIVEMGISKQAVSKLVDSLVTLGFVDRTPNAADRRRTDLELSAKGQEAADHIGDAVRTMDEAVARELGAERFDDLMQMLTELSRRQD
jgi:DNA-binding MarR family transcriptional regulator